MLVYSKAYLLFTIGLCELHVFEVNHQVVHAVREDGQRDDQSGQEHAAFKIAVQVDKAHAERQVHPHLDEHEEASHEQEEGGSHEMVETGRGEQGGLHELGDLEIGLDQRDEEVDEEAEVDREED